MNKPTRNRRTAAAIVAWLCLLPLAIAQDDRMQPDAKQLSRRYQALKPACEAMLERFEPATFTDSSQRVLPYRLFRPEPPDSGKKLPLVVFLHGLGGKGNNNEGQMTDQIIGPAVWSLKKNQEKHPCFVLAPQSSGFGGFWCWPKKVLPAVRELIDKVARQEAVDVDRIYITGLSMGGFGTWDLIAAHPDFFAAAAPVCGRGDPAAAAVIVEQGLPVWAFHGAEDGLVAVAGSRQMVRALEDAGGAPRYTEYPGLGHNSWEAAYSDPELIDWMFSHRKSDR